MKYLLTKSKILDLNYTFVQSGSGSVDNVTYSVPAHSQGVLSVDAQGKVTALVEQGTGIVEIKSGNALLQSVAIEVMPLADYNIAMGIKAGSTPLSVSSVNVVPQAPTLTLVSGSPIGSNGVNGRDALYAIDGLPETWFESLEMYSNMNGVANVGVQFSSPKKIKKLKIKVSSPPRYIHVKTSQNGSTWTTVHTIELSTGIQYDAPQNPSVLVWQEFTIPDYTAANYISLWPVSSEAVPGTWWALNNPGGQIDRFRVHEMEFYTE